MVEARESEKDPDAFRTISEVADELSLPQHVLRFWETRFHQVKPVKRAGGRRFYRPEDVDLLRGIRRLLYEEGFTIKGAQKILKDQGIRHVQDLGIEGDVAVIRNNAEDIRTPPSEGKSFGGLLGLLPLRRGKSQEEQRHEPLPTLDEPHLPFDELGPLDDFAPENEETQPAPPRSRGTSQRVEERRFDGSVYEERIVEERRFEREAVRPPEVVAQPLHDSLQHDDTPYSDFVNEEPHQPPSPSFAPEPVRDSRSGGRQRIEPALQTRPSRGPAAHIASPARPEFQDTLLPFMDDFSQNEVASESLEERIRRLKEHEQRRTPPVQSGEEGPPAEYVPQRHRQRSAAEAEQGVQRYEEEMEDDLPSLVRGVSREKPQEPHMADEHESAHIAPPTPSRLRAQSHDPASHGSPHHAGFDNKETGHFDSRSQNSSYLADSGPRPLHPAVPETQTPPRRFGPFTEPVVEEFEIEPVDMRRAPDGRPVWEERRNWEEEYPDPRLQQRAHPAQPRSERQPPAAAPRMRYGMEHHDSLYSPAPHQPPPYGEGRWVMGQGVMPVLSREDVHRLQAALYELSECQRLMEGLLVDEKD